MLATISQAATCQQRKNRRAFRRKSAGGHVAGRIQRFDFGREICLDRGPPQFERRRQFALLDGKRPVQQREIADLLVMRETIASRRSMRFAEFPTNRRILQCGRIRQAGKFRVCFQCSTIGHDQGCQEIAPSPMTTTC